MANAQLSQSLVSSNAELRERNMGRIAAIVFDWSFHRTNSVAGQSTSAFSDPVAMEQFCGVLACNAVSSGPTAVRHLVSDWILPGVDSQQLPPQAVVAIILHISVEARGKGCPAGTKDVISALLPSVCMNIIGPILLESLRDGDEGGSSGGVNINHRIAAISLRSLESWCRANEIGAVKLQKIFNLTNVRMFLHRDEVHCLLSSKLTLSLFITFFLHQTDQHTGQHSRRIVFKFRSSNRCSFRTDRYTAAA